MSLGIHLRSLTSAYVAVAVIATASTSMAAKGGNGNGGGKPGGGDDPPAPTAPVTYSVTPVSMPGTSFYFNDHNGSAAAVGWDFEQAVAYLPSVSASSGVYLNDIASGFAGVDDSWSFRSAVGINNHGDIVGTVEPADARDTIKRSFLIMGADGLSPSVHYLDFVDPAAAREVAVGINDSGDTLIRSEVDTPDGVIKHLYVGNPGLHGVPAVPFSKIEFADGGQFGYGSPVISNRVGSGGAVVVGIADTADGNTTFRLQLDGSPVEYAPQYEDASGIAYKAASLSNSDVNDFGDLTMNALAYKAKPNGNLGNFNTFAALWTLEPPNEYTPIASDDPTSSSLTYASLNNDGDYVFLDDDLLWHGKWSETNGMLSITSLIQDDPNADLYIDRYDLLDRDTTTGWPTVLARGEETIGDTTIPYLLILTPQLTTSAITTATVPEPATGVSLVTGVALLGMLRFRSRSHRVRRSARVW